MTNSKSMMARYAKPAHKKAARALGYALTLGDAHAWVGASQSFSARLTEVERAGLAWAALRALGPEKAVTVTTSLFEGAGQPIAPLFDHMDEAAFWVDTATPAELEAYCLASYSALPPARQAAFLDYVQGRAAA